MDPRNKTGISDFVLLGLSEDPELQPLIFGLFLSMYLLTLLGNLILILAFCSDSHLHIPMYFFLSNLSLEDICLTSTVIPKMLHNIWTHNKDISYAGCITQMCFYILFISSDNFLLTVMAYDRYVAICHPLHYMVIMSPRLCGILVLLCWLVNILYTMLQTLMVLRLSFCEKVEIHHFFCELKQMITLACSDTSLNDLVVYLAAVLVAGVSTSGILYSYSKIISSILRISSAQGKCKAFSTCASHLSVVFLFYSSAFGVYLSSGGARSSRGTASVWYTLVMPMLNPFIYSLRNKDIKVALKTLFQNKTVK